MRFIRRSVLALASAMLVLGGIYAQAQASAAKPNASSETDEDGNSVGVETGIVGSDVEMTGSAIINGVVYIDGERLPSDKTTYTSKKTGKTYLIKRGKNGNVSVVEK